MTGIERVVFISCIVVGCGVGCSRHDDSAAGPSLVEIQSALAARSAVCTLTLPFGSDASRFVVGANGSMQLGDRVLASDPIENMGGGGTQLGADAQLGDIYSISQITLRDRTTVHGSVFTTLPVSATATSQLLGPVNSHAVLTPAATQSLPANFPAAGDVDILLEPDQTAQPAPGRYRNVQVKSRATLSLRTGTYFFETFGVIEPQAQVVLDERQGPVIIFANQPVTFRGVVHSNLGQPDWLIGVVGGGAVTIESSFQGTILAPLAAINLGTGGLTHTGAFFARDVLAQPGTTFVHRTSSALSRCATVLGGKRSSDLTALEQQPMFDPVTGAPFPGTFVHGVDQCADLAAQPTAPPGPDGLATFQLVANPSCATPLRFCDPVTGNALSPQPTLAQLNAAPPPGSSCRAQPAVDRCLCPVNPISLGSACNFSSDCPNGTVCATVCSGPGCQVPRRCGTYVAGCDGLPELANCQDLEVCPDPESVGTVTLDDLKSSLKSPTTPPTPGGTPQPVQKPVDHFDGAATLIAAGRSGSACGLGPVRAGLPVVDQAASNGTRQGKASWGIRFTPTLSQKTASTTLEPFGVAIPSFSANAGLDVVATVFGQDISVLSAQATVAAELCSARADVSVTVGPFGDESPGNTRETGASAQKLCSDAETFLERATTILNWSEAQVLAVIDQFQTLGPDTALCGQMNSEFPDLSPPLDCTGDPVGSARRIVDRLSAQYRSAATDAIGRAGGYASALAGIDSVSGENISFFDKPLEVLGAEANFPIGPFVVTVGGSVNAHFAVDGSPHLDLASSPGGVATIGAGFTVTPSASVDATALIGVGFVVVTVGVEGIVHLIGIQVPVTAEVEVQSRPTPDPRVPANDGYSFGPLSDRPEFSLLKSQRYGWDTSWKLDGDLHIDSFLSGELDGFVRLKFLFFSKTFRRKIVSWNGISPQSIGVPPVISLFALHSPLPFSGTVPPILTASRFAYVNPPAGDAITIAPPQPPPSDAGLALSPVAVKNLSGLVEDIGFQFCEGPPR